MTYRIVAKHSSMCLSLSPDILIQQIIQPNNPNQLWTVESLQWPSVNIRNVGMDEPLGGASVTMQNTIEDPLHCTITSSTTQKALDVDLASTSDGANVIWWRPNGRPNQCWSLVLDVNSSPIVESDGLEYLNHEAPALDSPWDPPTSEEAAQGQRPASNQWSEARKRRSTSDISVKYGGSLITVSKGSLFYIDSAGRILVGWHGSVSPPCEMDGNPLIVE